MTEILVIFKASNDSDAVV